VGTWDKEEGGGLFVPGIAKKGESRETKRKKEGKDNPVKKKLGGPGKKNFFVEKKGWKSLLPGFLMRSGKIKRDLVAQTENEKKGIRLLSAAGAKRKSCSHWKGGVYGLGGKKKKKKNTTGRKCKQERWSKKNRENLSVSKKVGGKKDW